MRSADYESHLVWVDRPDMVMPSGPLTPAERAELEADESAIREAWLGMGKALSQLRYGLEAHRNQRTVRGRPIPTEAGRWRAYVEQHCPGTTPTEAEACMGAFHRDLAIQHHSLSPAQPT